MEGVMTHADTLDLITERVIAAMGLEEPMDRYPDRACFLPADAPGHSESAGRALAEGKPVVLVFPSGDEVVIEPAENGTPMRVEARDASGRPLAA
jgi:hypothetical protein